MRLKKPLLYSLLIVAGAVAGALICGVIFLTAGLSVFGSSNNGPDASAEGKNAELTAIAYRAASYLKDGDFIALSKAAHPEFGIVFSPYAEINFSTNKCFQTEQIELFGKDTKLYIWGVYAGSGEPIELTVADYFAEFVFDRDYTAAPVVGVNTIIKSGDAPENITDVSADVQFVDFHIPGGDKDNGGDDHWSTLRLGFERYEGKLWLTVIMHSGRTT